MVNVQQDLFQFRSVEVRKQTVCRRQKEASLKARGPAKDPIVLLEHRASRNNFFENYGEWNISEWPNTPEWTKGRMVEHLWDESSSRVRSRDRPPESIVQMAICLPLLD